MVDTAAQASTPESTIAPQGEGVAVEPQVNTEIEDDTLTPADPTSSPDLTAAQSSAPSGPNVLDVKKIQNIKVKVQAMLGEVSMSVSQLANLKQGEFVSLETKVGDAIDILANGHLIARGEIVVIEEDAPRFGVTITQVVENDASAG